MSLIPRMPLIVEHAGRHREQHMTAVRNALRHLNQALLTAANDGVEIRLMAGEGPYTTGPTHETRRSWVEVCE